MKTVLLNTKYLILLAGLLQVLCSEDFGPFDVQILDFQVKIYNKKDVDLKVNISCRKNGVCSLNIFGHVKKNMGALGVRIRNFRLEEQSNVLAFTIETKNICKHAIFKLLISFLPGIDRDCNLKPNVYNVTIPDLAAFGRLLFNNMFYYGKYISITELRGGRGKFLQLNCSSLIVPQHIKKE